MTDESVKVAYKRLLGTIGDALPYIERLVKDTQAAVAAAVASEERHEAFNERAMAQLRAAGATIEEAPKPAPVLSLVPAPAAEDRSGALPSTIDEDTNPWIEHDPKAWLDAHGAKGSMKGHRLSECPTAYLDMMAAGLDKRAAFFEGKGETAKAAEDRRLAGHARAHIAMLRPAPREGTEHRTISADDILKGRAK